MEAELLELVSGHAAVQVGLVVGRRGLFLFVQRFPEFFSGTKKQQKIKIVMKVVGSKTGWTFSQIFGGKIVMIFV